MIDLENLRTASESRFRAELATLDERRKKRLLALLAQYGSVAAIPESEWRDLERDAEERTVVAILLAALAADAWTTQEIRRLGVSTSAVDARGTARYAALAGRAAIDFAEASTRTLRERLDRGLENVRLETGGRSGLGEATSDEISDLVDEILTAERRETTAADSTTISLTIGQRGAAERAEEGAAAAEPLGDGVSGGTTARPPLVDMIWMTADDLPNARGGPVCPRCAPLRGASQAVWSKIFPAGPGWHVHPRCRCWLRPQLAAGVAA